MIARTGWLWVAGQAVLLGALILLPGSDAWPTPSLLVAIAAVLFFGGLALRGFRGLSPRGCAHPDAGTNNRGQLTTNGLYRFMRHPIYTGVLLVVAGMVLRSGSWLQLAIGVVTVVFFDRKAAWEEGQLAARYPGYTEYAGPDSPVLPAARLSVREPLAAVGCPMPRVESSVLVPVSPELAFAVSQTTGEVRFRWDPFVSKQHFLDGATKPAKGVRTETISRHRLRMVSEYTSFRPPTQVGMKMVEGPWFFDKFAGGWSFREADGGTEATWRYTFSTRPSFLSPLTDRIGSRLLGLDIDRRIAGFAKGCEDEVVLAAARATLD